MKGRVIERRRYHGKNVAARPLYEGMPRIISRAQKIEYAYNESKFDNFVKEGIRNKLDFLPGQTSKVDRRVE